MKYADDARRLADQHRGKIEALDHVVLKLACFQGVLDWAAKMEAEGDWDAGVICWILPSGRTARPLSAPQRWISWRPQGI